MKSFEYHELLSERIGIRTETSSCRNQPAYCHFYPLLFCLLKAPLRIKRATMQVYIQTEDIAVIGIQVMTFPNGIKEAFGDLMKILGSNRDYYGVSWMDEENRVTYYAMAKEIVPGEGESQGYERLTIGKGDYKAKTLHDWPSKTDCIKNVFQLLTNNNKPDKQHPCIEWYKSDEEMLCMIKAS